MEFSSHQLPNTFHHAVESIDISDRVQPLKKKVLQLFALISSIGYSATLDDYEKRKLGIFNQLNFFQLVTGIVVPIVFFLTGKTFPVHGKYIAILPAFISLLVLALNFFRRYHAALLCYFILYPVFTCVIYINGFSLGIELSFVLYGILSVFFLQDIGYMLFAVSLSMISYFVLSIAWKDYRYQLEVYNYRGFLINHALSIIYIFYGLYLIKRENSDYQLGITRSNDELSRKNAEIEDQARLLASQTSELNELNKVKDKLFSIISHDLKAPMYALQNLFINAKRLDLPAEEIKSMIPAVVNDLNYTTALIENLLHWAKNQMQSTIVIPQRIDLSRMVHDTVQLLQLQASEKEIVVETKTDQVVHAWADKNMISLVIRNLLSNAIKFTPDGGRITIGTHQVDSESKAYLYVRDTGYGISQDTMDRINADQFYSTNGTHNETGTGLGLILCKEFLSKNGGSLMIESDGHSGSCFSFTIPAE